MFFYLERLAFALEHDGYVDVERGVVRTEGRVVGVLHETAGPFAVAFRIDVFRNEVGVHVLDAEQTAAAVHHGLVLARPVYDVHRHDARLFTYAVVVGAERGGDMYDARTVHRGHVVAGDDAEGVAHRLHPVDELPVAYSDQFRTLVNPFPDAVRSLHLRSEIGWKQFFGENDRLGLLRVGIEAFHTHVFDVVAHGERRVGGQRPGRRGPCEEVERTLCVIEQEFAPLVADDFELRRAGRVLHVAVASRLVELVVAEARTRGRRVRLYRISLVEQALIEKLFQHPPQRLDIFVFVGDVGVFHVHPISHFAGELLPDAGELHHRFTAGTVVLLDGYLVADVLFRDAELLLHAQFDRQAVGIPSRLPADEIALLGFVAADSILDGTREDVVDAGESVGRRRPFVEDESRCSFAFGDAASERVLSVPHFEDFPAQLRQVEPLVLVEFSAAHICYESLKPQSYIKLQRMATARCLGRSVSACRGKECDEFAPVPFDASVGAGKRNGCGDAGVTDGEEKGGE